MIYSIKVLLITHVVEIIFHGIYVITQIWGLRCIFADEGWRLRAKTNRLMSIASILIFLLSTINVWLSLDQIKVLILPGLASWSSSRGIVMDLSEFVAILIADIFMVYRCWLVYGKSWGITCVPATFCIAYLISLVLTTYYQCTLHMGFAPQTHYSHSMDVALSSLYACNIATNLCATLAIAYRIRKVANASSITSKRLYRIVRIITETGALYTSMTILTMVLAIVFNGNIQIAPGKSRIAAFRTDNVSMAGISFNFLVSRIYSDRFESANSFADSRTAESHKATSLPQPNIEISTSYGESTNKSDGVPNTVLNNYFVGDRVTIGISESPSDHYDTNTVSTSSDYY